MGPLGQRSIPLEHQGCAQGAIRTDRDIAHAAGTDCGRGLDLLCGRIEIADRKANCGQPRAALRGWRLRAEAVAKHTGPHHLDFAARRLDGDSGRAGNEAARQYIDGKITAPDAAAFLEKYALYSPDRAKQRVRFIDQYRSYVINYNLGKDMVRRYVESRGGTPDNPKRRWEEFEKLLSSPRLPSGLK